MDKYILFLLLVILTFQAQAQDGRSIESGNNNRLPLTYVPNCRCERRNKCERLQISVAHRCPEDFFFCCFPRLPESGEEP